MKKSLVQRLPFYYGWVIVAFGFVFGAFNVGMTSWGLGVFVTPMQEELDWDRGLVFLPLLVGALVTLPMGIILGPLADKQHGPRLMAIIGVILFGLSMLYMREAGDKLGYILIFGVVGGFGRFTVQIALVVVPKWFVRRRGLAQASVSAGFSVGPLIFPLILQSLVDNIGWRDAWFVMGLGLLALALPGAFLIIRSPEDVGLLPDGDKPEDVPATNAPARAATPSPAPPPRTEVNLTRKEALRTRQFWLLVVAIGLATVGIRGMIPNFQPFFVSLDIGAITTTLSITAYAVPAIIMGFVFGIMADRHGPRKPFLIVCSIVASGLVFVFMVSVVESVVMMFAAMIYLGFGLNAFFVVSQVFVANTFGRQHIGAIRGVMQTVNNLATFGGPWLFGVMYDVSTEYFVLFAVAVGFWMVTITLGMLVRPLMRPPAQAAPGTA